MFELNDEVWGIDPVVNKFHRCQGTVVAVHQNPLRDKLIYLVDFHELGTAIMNEHQITKQVMGEDDVRT